MPHGGNFPNLTRTHLVEETLVAHAEDANTPETLTINCVEGGVTPVPTTPRAGTTSQPQGTPLPPTEQAKATGTAAAKATATAAAQGPTSDDGDGGLSGVVIAIIAVAAVAVAGGGGFLGWRYYQSRRGAGGGT